VVDEDPAHDLRRRAEEVRPVLPVVVLVGEQAEVGLVHERSRLQNMTCPFVVKAAARQPLKFWVNHFDQGI
jgi:hypothetical protein